MAYFVRAYNTNTKSITEAILLNNNNNNNIYVTQQVNNNMLPDRRNRRRDHARKTRQKTASILSPNVSKWIQQGQRGSGAPWSRREEKVGRVKARRQRQRAPESGGREAEPRWGTNLTDRWHTPLQEKMQPIAT